MDPPSGDGGAEAASTSSTRIGGILREAPVRDVPSVPLPEKRTPSRRNYPSLLSVPPPQARSSRRNLGLRSPYFVAYMCSVAPIRVRTRVRTHKVSRKSPRRKVSLTHSTLSGYISLHEDPIETLFLKSVQSLELQLY